MKKTPGLSARSAPELMTKRIAHVGGWRSETLARMRELINEADPDVVEELKWMGTPVWGHDGNICTGEFYKNVVKLTFVKGAFLEDPKGLFNSSLEGKTRRAIDIREGEAVDEAAFKALFLEAVAVNRASSAGPGTAGGRRSAAGTSSSPRPRARRSTGRRPGTRS